MIHLRTILIENVGTTTGWKHSQGESKSKGEQSEGLTYSGELGTKVAKQWQRLLGTRR